MIHPAKQRPCTRFDQQQPIATGRAHDLTQIRIIQEAATGRIGQQSGVVPRSPVKNDNFGNQAFHGAMDKGGECDSQGILLVLAFNQNTDHGPLLVHV